MCSIIACLIYDQANINWGGGGGGAIAPPDPMVSTPMSQIALRGNSSSITR